MRERGRAEAKMKVTVDVLRNVVLSAPGLDFRAGGSVKRREETCR